MPKAIFATASVALLCGAWIVGAGGCGAAAPTTQPATAYDRQEQLLHDPFSYTPDLRSTDNKISGNGEYDREGLKRDVDHVLNP